VLGCVKVNTDGSSFGAPAQGEIGGVFRDWHAACLGGFSQNIGHATCLEAEFCAVMFAIDKAVELGWTNLWIECDSLQMVKAFMSRTHVPWHLRTRWINCMERVRRIHYVCSHIHQEGNTAADALLGMHIVF